MEGGFGDPVDVQRRQRKQEGLLEQPQAQEQWQGTTVNDPLNVPDEIYNHQVFTPNELSSNYLSYPEAPQDPNSQSWHDMNQQTTMPGGPYAGTDYQAEEFNQSVPYGGELGAESGFGYTSRYDVGMPQDTGTMQGRDIGMMAPPSPPIIPPPGTKECWDGSIVPEGAACPPYTGHPPTNTTTTTTTSPATGGGTSENELTDLERWHRSDNNLIVPRFELPTVTAGIGSGLEGAATLPQPLGDRQGQITSPGVYDTRIPNTEQAIDTGNIPGQADVFETQTYPGGLQQLGTDPLSRLQAANLGTLMTTGGIAPTPMAGETESALVDSLANRGTGAEFETRFGQGVQDELQRLIDTGGALPVDRQQRAMEVEGVRSYLDDLRDAQLAQGTAAMADRGLLGQGPEYDFRERVEDRIAPQYAQAAQQLDLARQAQEDQRYSQALGAAQQMGETQRARGQEEYLSSLQLATGMTLGESQQLLNTIATTGDLQQNMQGFALDLLRENTGWAQFLAQLGMERETVEELVTRGRLQDVVGILNTYVDLAQVSQRGFVTHGTESDRDKQ